MRMYAPIYVNVYRVKKRSSRMCLTDLWVRFIRRDASARAQEVATSFADPMCPICAIYKKDVHILLISYNNCPCPYYTALESERETKLRSIMRRLIFSAK